MATIRTKRLLSEAIRLGDAQAAQIVALANQLRRLKQKIFRAVAHLDRGQPDTARRILKEEGRQPRGAAR